MMMVAIADRALIVTLNAEHLDTERRYFRRSVAENSRFIAERSVISRQIVAEEQQPQRDIYRPADAGSDLRERHQAHAVAGGQDRHIAGAALPALATGNNRHIDRVHPYLFTNQKPVATSAETVLTITSRLVKVKAFTSSCHGVIATPTAKRIGR